MNHFLVRLGKSKYSELFMPVLNCAVVSIYSGIQFGCHDQLRRFLGAQSPSGRLEKISNHLRALIEETHDICTKKGFNKRDDSFKMVTFSEATIKWFVSSTLEPITFGTLKLSSGVLIGLPNFYNYSKLEDIPDSAFVIKKMALFRSPQDKELEERLRVKAEGLVLGDQSTESLVVRRIERDSADGQEYTKSLLLSDDAKRFSIARELYLAETFRTLYKSASLIISCTLALTVARVTVSKLNLRQSHIYNRLSVYLLSGILGYGNNHFLSQAIDQTSAEAADRQAKSLGESYELGAAEYFEKRAKRNYILGINQ